MNLLHRSRPALRTLAAGLVLLALTLFTAAPAASADQVEELIGSAAEAYRDGNLKMTLELLSRAITDIQNRLSLILAGLPGT